MKNSNQSYRIKTDYIRFKDIPKSIFLILRKYGWLVLFHKSVNYFKLRLKKRVGKGIRGLVRKEISVNEVLLEKFSNSQPIKYIKVDRDEFRFNIVTDSLKKSSLFGGVATSLIMATLFANKYKIPLRIITRETENNPNDYEDFLSLMNIAKPENVEYFSDYDRNSIGNNFKLETSDKDIFLSTSWWSSEAVKHVNLRPKFFYILQEVETFFYPNGDEQYMCNDILNDPSINFIINSKLLHEYYNNMGFENIINNGIFFEPAFPAHVFFPNLKSFIKKPKYKLFFYSRPGNPRNLFYIGLKLLDEAISNGIINNEEWDVVFAGSDVPSLVFSNGIKPRILGQMSWVQYREFIGTVDLGFCLMFTPHPSYPPLDIAASGGVVLTNKFMNKQTLNYSDNIICENLNNESMMKAFEQAIDLVKNASQRRNNYENNKIERNWEKSFEKVLIYMNENK